MNNEKAKHSATRTIRNTRTILLQLKRAFWKCFFLIRKLLNFFKILVFFFGTLLDRHCFIFRHCLIFYDFSLWVPFRRKNSFSKSVKIFSSYRLDWRTHFFLASLGINRYPNPNVTLCGELIETIWFVRV